MDVENIMKLGITLQKLSLAVLAVHLWELKSVKNKICETFDSGCCEWMTESQKIDQIFDYVVDKVPLLGVPKKISEEIKKYVYIIGGLIFYFMEHINRNEIDVAPGTNFCWTSNCRIDGLEMCGDFLKESSEGQVLENHSICLAKHKRACDMEKDRKAKTEEVHLFDIIKFIIKWRHDRAEEFMNWLYDNEEERKDAKKLLYALDQRDPLKYCIDLFHKMELNEIYADKNFVRPHISKIYEKFDESKYRSLAIFFEHKYVFYSMLRKLLEKSQNKIKQNYFTKKSVSPLNCFTDLTQKKNWVALSIILNDGSLKELKEDVVYGSQIGKLMRDRVLCGSFKFVNNFLKYVVSTEEEIKIFKRKIDWIERFASEGNVKAADRVLNWACDTEEERKERKEEILRSLIVKFIHEKRFDSAEELVNWLYDTEEERKDAKKKAYVLGPTNPLKYCTGLFHKMEFKEIYYYLTWWYSEEEEGKNIRKALRALEKNDPKEICENLIGESGKYCYKDKIEVASCYLKLQFETEEERRDFKERLYKSEECLLEKCKKVLIPMDTNYIKNFDRIDYINCFAILKFYLETEEAVVEFETNNIFTEEFFLINISNMPFKNFEEFLQFRNEMRKEIDKGKKNISYESICRQFNTDLRCILWY